MFGPVAMAYNVEGVDKLVVNGDVLAKIFQGQITKWNDPAIAALNCGRHPARRRHHADLPLGLVGHHRQLPEVPGRRCAGDVDQGRWQGVPGRRGRGRAEVVRRRAGRPGHPGCHRLRGEGLRRSRRACPTRRSTAARGAVELTDETTAKAVDAAKFKAEGNDLTLDLDALYASKEAGSYPLMLATYEIVCSKGYDADTAAAVKSFLTVAANEGQANLLGCGLRAAAGRFQGATAQVRRRNRASYAGAYSTNAVRMGVWNR